MAQDGTTAGGSSYTIDNVTFPVGRTKLQSIFDAIRSTNIGNTAPDLVAGQFWIDNNTPSTTVWTLYFYDGTDNISFATIDTINNTVNFLDSTFDLINDTTPQLGGTLDANGNNIDMGTNLITDTKVGQWDTAYSWGDHSTEGYITASSTDTLINKSGNISQWTNDAGYLTSETDSQTLSFSNPNLSISNGNSVDLSALDTGILNVVEDTTPQLGGDLNLNSSDITGTGNVNITGTITSSGDITTSGVLNSIAPTRHSIRPSLNLDFANSKALDPRITFTRASNATYYDGYTSVKAEENLYINSQALNSWGSGRLDKFADDTTAPDGTTTADRLQQQSGETFYGYIVQAQTVVSGLSYTQSGYFKAGTNRNFVTLQEAIFDGTSNVTWFNLSTGAVGTTNAGHTATITDVGNGWYRCSITYTANGNRTGNTAFYVSETDGSSTVTDNQGFIYGWGLQFEQRDTATAYTPTTSSPITKYQPALQTAGNNVARFDHNPTTGESLGLLIEESRTNLQVYSEEFDNGAWNKSATTIKANTIIAPDGTLTGDKLVPDTQTSGKSVFDNTISMTSGTTYTGSCYIKKGEYEFVQLSFIAASHDLLSYANFDLTNGTVGSAGSSVTNSSITDVGNGWYRCSITAPADATISGGGFSILNVPSSTASRVEPLTGDGYSGIYIWGAQVEQGTFATSYIKTTGSQVTRSADDCEMLNIDQDDWLKQGVGTLYGEFSKPYTGQDNGSNRYPRVFGLTNDQFDANEIAIYFTHATTPSIYSFIDKDDTNYHANNLISAPLANTYYKASIAYERNNVDSSGNGSNETTDTSVEIPFINRLRIFKRIAGQNLFNFGYIKKLSYYPIKLTKNEVIDLTEE